MEEEENKNPMKITSRDSTFINSNTTRLLLLKMKQKKNQKNKRRSTGTKQREISYDHVMQILIKPRNSRNLLENRLLAEYLSNKFDYFKKIKTSEPSKLEKLCKVLNYETFSAKETIINYGETGDKFYIVFNGQIGVYKPIYVEKDMSLNEFYSYMMYLKNNNQVNKMNRIMEKNQHLNIDLTVLAGTPETSYFMRKTVTFIMEENEKLGEFSNGFTFGEIALIKKSKRNATVIALKNSALLSIEKYDYNNVIRRLEEKRLEKEIYKFKNNYPFFYHWNNYNILEIFNCFHHLRLTQGEYLFKQNEESDSVFIVREGCYEMFTDISFAWLKTYLDYIINSEYNLFKKLEEFLPKKENDLIELIDYIKKNLPNCPSIIDKKFKKIKNANFGNNVFDIKIEEDELNEPNKLFRINLKKIDYIDIIGLEDSMDLKKRFCSVKCTSTYGYVEKIKLINLLKIIKSFKNDSKVKQTLENILQEKKIILLDLIINAIKNKVNFLEEDFDLKYKSIIEKHLNKKDEDSKNKQISTVKLSGWTKDLDYVLDENIHFHKYPKIRSLSKEIEKKIFERKTLNEKNFQKIIIKPIDSNLKNKILSPKNAHLNPSLLSPIFVKKNNLKLINVKSLYKKIKKRNKNDFFSMDFETFSDQVKKTKSILFKDNVVNMKKKNLTQQTTDCFYPSYNSNQNIIETEKSDKNIRKKLFIEGFNSGEKNFFLGGNFFNKIKEEINKNKKICFTQNVTSLTNLSSFFKNK